MGRKARDTKQAQVRQVSSSMGTQIRGGVQVGYVGEGWGKGRVKVARVRQVGHRQSTNHSKGGTRQMFCLQQWGGWGRQG